VAVADLAPQLAEHRIGDRRSPDPPDVTPTEGERLRIVGEWQPRKRPPKSRGVERYHARKPSSAEQLIHFRLGYAIGACATLLTTGAMIKADCAKLGPARFCGCHYAFATELAYT